MNFITVLDNVYSTFFYSSCLILSSIKFLVAILISTGFLYRLCHNYYSQTVIINLVSAAWIYQIHLPSTRVMGPRQWNKRWQSPSDFFKCRRMWLMRKYLWIHGQSFLGFYLVEIYIYPCLCHQIYYSVLFNFLSDFRSIAGSPAIPYHLGWQVPHSYPPLVLYQPPCHVFKLTQILPSHAFISLLIVTQCYP